MARSCGGTAIAAVFAVACSRPQPIEPVRLADPDGLDPEVVELVNEQVRRVERAPADARTHGTLGLVYEANDLWEAAGRSFANAAALAPEEPLWRYHRALALHQTGQTVQASAMLRAAAAELEDAPGVQHRLGHLLLDEGNLPGARAAFGRALARLPKQPECLVGLALVDVEEGRWESARDLCRNALRGDPTYKHAYYTLGLALRGLGETKGAAAALALGLDGRIQYVDDPLGAELKTYRVNYLGQSAEAAEHASKRQFDKAVALLERILAKRPNDAEMRSNYGAALLELGRIDEAIRALEAAIALDGSRFGPHVNLANALLRAGRLDEAMRHADTAVALGARVARAHTARAQVLAAREDLEGALAALLQAVACDAHDLTVLVMLTEVCARLDRIADAEAWCRKAIAIDPMHLPSRVNLASFALMSGRAEEARVQVRELQRIAPDEPRVQALAAEVGLPAAPRKPAAGSPR